MLPNEYFLPLTDATAQMVVDFCELFAVRYNLEQIPDEFISLAVEASDAEDQGIFVRTAPYYLAIGTLKDGVSMPVFDLAEITEIFAVQTLRELNNRPVRLSKEEPPTKTTAPASPVTAKEGMEEYKQILTQLRQIVKQCNIPLVSGSRLTNVKYILNLLAANYQNSQVYH